MGEMAIEKENYWPFCKEVIDTGIKLPLKPFEVVALFHSARLDR